MGQRVDAIDTAEKIEINTTTYESGVYFVRVITRDGQSLTKRVIVAH